MLILFILRIHAIYWSDLPRPNKNVLWVTGLKILGRVGTHIFFNYFFFQEKNINLCILKMHKIINFSENLKKIGFTSKFR